MSYLLLHNISTSLSALNDLAIQVEVSKVLSGTIDVIVDLENKSIVEELTTELELVLKDQENTKSEMVKIQEERRDYMREATILRDQLVHDYRNMLGQLDESRRQLEEARSASNNHSNLISPPSTSNNSNNTNTQNQEQPPPPTYSVARSLIMLPDPPTFQPSAVSPDHPFRKITLAPAENPGRVVKKILSYFDANDIYALCYTSKFYSHLINWIFEEVSTPPPLVDVLSHHTITPPPPPPPPYTPTTTSTTPSQEISSNSNSRDSSASRLKRAEKLSRSMSRREMREITKIASRCKLLEKRVMILTNEKDDLLSQADASANVKQFLLDKIKTLETEKDKLQNQTDNDQQIITFLDDSIKTKERERTEWMIERDAYEAEKLKWIESSKVKDKREIELMKAIDQLKSQKKVLVNEVKRLRRESSESSRSAIGSTK
jgi:hypothetical protein